MDKISCKSTVLMFKNCVCLFGNKNFEKIQLRFFCTLVHILTAYMFRFIHMYISLYIYILYTDIQILKSLMNFKIFEWIMYVYKYDFMIGWPDILHFTEQSLISHNCPAFIPHSITTAPNSHWQLRIKHRTLNIIKIFIFNFLKNRLHTALFFCILLHLPTLKRSQC